ncbi:MAG: hypothetical protein B9S32_05025 [Verrucomicrobia bacterium Tous-C9LFEB]|nr:MAG: hypothetical protein B9S32_05025 [Verrucomicrobia bacterium Tous-C9LFEB]
MLPLALSTCWNSSRHTDGAEMLREIRDMGFTRAELGHGVRYSLWPGVLDAIDEGVIEISSLHNFCPVPMGVMKPSPNCFELTDPRPILRQQAINATIETIHNAAKLEVPVVVMHLGHANPYGINRELEKLAARGKLYSREYVAAKLKAVELRRKLFPEVWERLHESLLPIVEAAAKEGIKLGFENRERYEEFPSEEEFQTVLDAFPAETVGYWHDFGHAARKEYLGWSDHRPSLERFAPRLIGCHVQDCLPPDEDHLGLGKGEVPFADLLPLVQAEAVPVLELAPSVSREDVLASLELWKTLSCKISAATPT